MKSNVVGLLVIVLILMIALLGYMNPDFNLLKRDCMVTSRVDKEAYSVQEEYENKQHAADILAEVNGMYVRVITHLKQTAITGPWRSEIEFLSANYNPTVLGEHIPTNLKFTSYVAQKGKKIRLCLRPAYNRHVFHDMNTLKFVALHELTHMMVQSYGHEQSFWDAFQFVLFEADKIGEIKLIDYSKRPQQYCGIMIESSPAFSN